MRPKQFDLGLPIPSGTLLLFLGIFASTVKADLSLTVLASFDGTNGRVPEAALIQGRDGAFYGTTMLGGFYTNYGTVFKVTTGGTFTNLISFNNTNGASPQAGLMQATDGKLYGTTYQGGAHGDGTVFAISTNGTTFNSVSFDPDFDGPNAVLAQGPSGDFFGTTEYGGTNHEGSVFKMTPSGMVTNLVSFDGTNGSYPYDGGLVMGADENFYGTTQSGGIGFDSSVFYSGWGTVFRMRTNGTLTTLTLFNGTNGAFPVGVLAQGIDGSLYGTTGYGGIGFDGLPYSGSGTVFKITTNGTLTTLAMFNGTNTGANPFAGVIIGTDGNLYGTTQYGGTNYPPSPNAGTVFRVTPDGTLTTLVSFKLPDGGQPIGGLLQGSDGNFYGTTTIGGINGMGNVFRLTVPGVEAPKLQVVANSGAPILNWIPLAGRTYQVQYKTNLNQAAWNNLGGTIIATNRIATISDPTSPESQRFYRVALLP
jgi:uncharacterized repeat protein (TIGR03803 family)